MPSRQLLLRDICDGILNVIPRTATRTTPNEQTIHASRETHVTEQFQTHFHRAPLRNVVLDFESVDEGGEPRTQESRIKRRVINRDVNWDSVIAILGIGGVGKSTILEALGNGLDVRERFRDGIHFVSLGMDATARTLVEGLTRVWRNAGAKDTTLKPLCDNLSHFAIQEVVHKAVHWFQGKSCLFLVDDVWTKDLDKILFAHLVELDYACQESKVMFTTRELELASVAPSRKSIFRVTPRGAKEKESRDILFCHSGIKEARHDSLTC